MSRMLRIEYVKDKNKAKGKQKNNKTCKLGYNKLRVTVKKIAVFNCHFKIHISHITCIYTMHLSLVLGHLLL